MARHVAEVCGAYTYIEQNILVQMQTRATPLIYSFSFFVFLCFCCFSYTFTHLLYISLCLSLTDNACTNICIAPTGAVYLAHGCFVSHHAFADICSHMTAQFEEGRCFFVCCSHLQEFADRVCNSRKACLKCQFTTTDCKTKNLKNFLHFIFIICCFLTPLAFKNIYL